MSAGYEEALPQVPALPRWLGGTAVVAAVLVLLTAPARPAVLTATHCPPGVACDATRADQAVIAAGQALFPASRVGATTAWRAAGRLYWQQVQLITADRGSVALVAQRSLLPDQGVHEIADPDWLGGGGPVTVTARRGGWLLTAYLVPGMSGDVPSLDAARAWVLTGPLPRDGS